MRIAMLLNFAPRKLGTFEDWLTEIATHARRRGHALDFYGREPIHPVFQERVHAAGANWYVADQLEQHPVRGRRRLARYDVLYLHMVAIRHPLARLCYSAWPAKVLLCDHSDWPAEWTQPTPGVRAKRVLDRLAFRRISALATVSNFIAERDLEHFAARPERLWTIHNGVDLKRFTPAETLFARAEPVVLTVAYMVSFKGVRELLLGFAPLAQRARLRIVGDGPEQASLEALAEELGVRDRVEFAGLSDDVDLHLRDADVFVHPAWREAFGLTIAEAMACGKAIVATRVGGIPELIRHGENGLLVPPRDPEAIRGALEQLLDDPALRERLGRMARLDAASRFDVVRSAQRHVRFCETFGMRRRSSPAVSWQTELAQPG